jgi:hypothetical protein
MVTCEETAVAVFAACGAGSPGPAHPPAARATSTPESARTRGTAVAKGVPLTGARTSRSAPRRRLQGPVASRRASFAQFSQTGATRGRPAASRPPTTARSPRSPGARASARRPALSACSSTPSPAAAHCPHERAAPSYFPRINPVGRWVGCRSWWRASRGRGSVRVSLRGFRSRVPLPGFRVLGCHRRVV